VKWIDELVGLTSWGAKIGIGTFLTLELGEKYLTKRKHPRGEWSIWVAGVPWRIVSGGLSVVDWECQSLNTEQVKILNGKVLESILFEKQLSHITFKFSDEIVLEVAIEIPDDDSELVLMSKEDTYFLNGDGEIGHEQTTGVFKGQ